MVGSGLDASGLELLSIKQGRPGSDETPHATVFASPDGLANFRKKIEDFAAKNTKKKDGSDGRPKNADLAQSIALIVEAGLRQLWRSPQEQYPEGGGQTVWEVWLDPAQVEAFAASAVALGITVHADRLEFPEDVVVLVTSTPDILAQAVRRLAGIRALAAPSTTPEFFDGLAVEEQVNWVNDLLGRTTYPNTADPNYVTLLDTGVNRGHPLIQPALTVRASCALALACGFPLVGPQAAGRDRQRRSRMPGQFRFLGRREVEGGSTGELGFRLILRAGID